MDGGDGPVEGGSQMGVAKVFTVRHVRHYMVYFTCLAHLDRLPSLITIMDYKFKCFYLTVKLLWCSEKKLFMLKSMNSVVIYTAMYFFFQSISKFCLFSISLVSSMLGQGVCIIKLFAPGQGLDQGVKTFVSEVGFWG